MLAIKTVKSKVGIYLEVGNFKKNFPLDLTDSETFRATVEYVHDLHEELIAKAQTTLVDLLFKDGQPQYIYLRPNDTRGKSWTFQLQLYKDPVSETVYEKPVVASASVSQHGLESAFEVVWSKLALSLGLLEVPSAQALKFAMLAHYRRQYIYRTK